MKRIIFIILFVLLLTFPVFGHAAKITLALNPNSTVEPAGYKLYWGEVSVTYTVILDLGWHERDIPFAILTQLPAGKLLYFAATAYDDSGNESTFSAEVQKMVPGGSLPEIPKGHRIVAEF